MAEPAAFFGIGTELRIYDSGTDTYLAIPYLQSIDGPDETFDTVEVTSHSSLGGYKEYITGLGDGGELSCTINWHASDATHLALQAAQLAREITPFQLYWPMFDENNLMDFSGYVTELTRSSPTDEQITRDLTIKVTGTVEVSTE